MSPHVPDADLIVEQYELLRRAILAGGSSSAQGPGLSLFLTRGMSAWLTALTALVPCSPRSTLICRPAQMERPPVPPRGVSSDLTVVLADMVLACSVEVTG